MAASALGTHGSGRCETDLAVHIGLRAGLEAQVEPVRLRDDPVGVILVQSLGVVGISVGWLPIRHLRVK